VVEAAGKIAGSYKPMGASRRKRQAVIARAAEFDGVFSRVNEPVLIFGAP